MDQVATALLASFGAGLATGFGALPALFVRAPSERLSDAMLGLPPGS